MCKPDVLATQETRPESFSDDGQDERIVYSQEELDAMRQVRVRLLEEYGVEESRIGSQFLAVATINCKLRVDETVKKLKKMLDSMEPLQCPDGIPEQAWQEEAAYLLDPYAPCGKDYNGASTFWIRGDGSRTPKEQERHNVHAGIMYFLAIHADPVSLRQGITFVIDTTKVKTTGRKVGNESALQNFQQCFPLRPQAILIAGTNALTRVFVNATIKLASLFTKQKVLDRIKFVTVEQAKEKMPLSSAPKYVGGCGGGIDNVQDWVKQRLELLPVPDLDGHSGEEGAVDITEAATDEKVWAVGTFAEESSTPVEAL